MPKQLSASQTIKYAMNLDKLIVTLDKTTTVANIFVNHVQEHNLHAIPGAPHEYTPQLEFAKHILDMPLFSPDRHFQLLEDRVELINIFR
jgi:hypothetical protein